MINTITKNKKLFIIIILIALTFAYLNLNLENLILLTILPVKLYKSKKDFSTINNNSNKILNSNFVAGFIDGEGCFILRIIKDNKYSTGWRLSLTFGIGLNKKDLELLKSIQYTLGGIGNITKQGDSKYQWRVISKEDLIILIKFLDKYPLITQKWSDFKLFKQALEMYLNKEHLTIEGIIKLVVIKANINKGLPDELKEAFPSVEYVPRPLVTQTINDSQWLGGFASAEGCFMVRLGVSNTNKTGKQVRLKFKITQHLRDENLIKSFKNYLNCGIIEIETKTLIVNFVVTKFTDVYEKIIPFFKKNQIEGIKALDFNDFCEAAEIIKSGEHLTEEGIKKLMAIKNRMNKNRLIDFIPEKDSNDD